MFLSLCVVLSLGAAHNFFSPAPPSLHPVFNFKPVHNHYTMYIRKTIFSFLTLIAFILFQGFLSTNDDAPLKQLKAQFDTGMEQMSEALSLYETQALALNNNPSTLEKLKNSHLQARLAYKNIEFLVEYIDPFNAKRSFNGAPLPTTEPSVPEVQILEPTGLQVLDDLIFGDNPRAEKAKIIELVTNLRKEFETARPVLSAIPFTHRNVFECARREIIRIFTLGVTGFDTPASGNAMAEASAAYEGLHQALRYYLPLMEQKDRGLAITMDARLEYTSTFLKKTHDFDTFDRLDFLMNHINPLYDLIYEMQKQLNIETADEMERVPQAINYKTRGIFDADFLNAGFYAKIRMDLPNTDKRIALGRLLFFDPVLSKDNAMSCANCHQPEKAFTDGLPKSLGRDGKPLHRNAPTLINCVYSEHYFHDFREPQLDRQILHVVKEDNEFATDYIQILQKLKMSSAYRALFLEAYPEIKENNLTAYTISNAMAAYVATLQSFDSPFDDYVTGRNGVIEPNVTRGFNLFMGKAACGTCHFAPVFNGTVPPAYIESESEVIGVPAAKGANATVDSDEGRYDNQKPRDRAYFYQYSFKTPTVRNVAKTAPYMHNGVYDTLEEVMDFYNKGGGQGIGIKLPHQTLPFDNLQLSDQEQKDIVAFMRALNTPDGKFTAPDTLPTFDGKPEWNQRYQRTNKK